MTYYSHNQYIYFIGTFFVVNFMTTKKFTKIKFDVFDKSGFQTLPDFPSNVLSILLHVILSFFYL